MKLLFILFCCSRLFAQDDRWSQRGYIENRLLFYPRETPWDTTRTINETFLRYEFSLRLYEGLQFQGGLDAQTDTHNQTERVLHLSWDDRTVLRPALAIRTFNLQYRRGPFHLELGKQPLRWGVMDLFSPTEKFSPRDFLSPSGMDLLGVWAARAVVDTGRHSVELLYLPRFTPSRVALADQRWIFRARDSQLFQTRYRGLAYPGGPQFGARYHRVLSQLELSLCFFDGFQVLPTVLTNIDFFRRRVDYSGVYPATRWIGGDAILPWRGFLLKGEAAYLSSSSLYADNVWIWAAQFERVHNRWTLSGGYLGENVTVLRRRSDLLIDRVAGDSFSGRAVFSPNSRNSISTEWWLRRNLDSFVSRTLYTRSLKPWLRATGGWIWIAGRSTDTVGRYSRNSYLTVQLRYSF